MSAVTITEFLEARIAEDELAAYDLMGEREGDRVLAECAAKRAIIGLHENYVDGYTGPSGACMICEPGGWEWTASPDTAYPCPTVRALAAVYKDHHDYQETWG